MNIKAVIEMIIKREEQAWENFMEVYNSNGGKPVQLLTEYRQGYWAALYNLKEEILKEGDL